MEISRVNSEEKIGYLKVISGAMFAGKTTLLIGEYNNIKPYRPCLLFKPELDTRYSPAEIVSHNQEKVQAFPIRDISDIESYLDDYNAKNKKIEDIFVDELHFFAPDSYVYLEELAKRGIKIVASGLDWNHFQEKPFETVTNCLTIADYPIKLFAKCDYKSEDNIIASSSICNKKATRTMWRHTWLPKTKEDYVGGKDKYLSVCRKHYVPFSQLTNMPERYEKKEAKPIDCCQLTTKTIELFREKFLYHSTINRDHIFTYWRWSGLEKKSCADCQKKWDKEYDRLKKDENKEIKEKLLAEEAEKEKKYQEEAKRRGVINCLYEHFKNTPKKLQVVCDWDEVIQPLEPKVYYELSEREGAYYAAPWWKPNGTPFAEFFRDFWPNAPIYFSDYGSHSIYSDKSMINSCLTEAREEGVSYALGQRSVKEKIDKIKNEPDFYEHSPFLTIAKELLKLVKENKVEVIFLSAYDRKAFKDGDPRKKKIFSETFGKFPNCSLNLVGFDSEGNGQSKSEWVKENVPDCDVMIDDNPNILNSVIENNKKIIAVAPFYPTINQHEKVLLVKTSLSNLTKENFQHE